MLELLLGQVPEAIYFALFMIFAKRLKNKTLIFTFMVTLEYIILFQVFQFSMWSHALFFIMTYLILKILYEEKAQITDVFTLGVASIIVLAVSMFTGFIFWYLLHNFTASVFIQKILLFLVLFVLKDKLYNMQNMYKNWWNRNDSIEKPIKSVTFRAVNVVIFNIMFLIINVSIILGAMIGGVK